MGEETRLWTKPMVEDYLQRTDRAFLRVNSEWARAAKAKVASAEDLDGWKAFFVDWQGLRKAIDESWSDVADVVAPFDARAATVERIDQYRRGLNKWARRAAKALGPLGAAVAPIQLKPASSTITAWWARFGSELGIALAVAGATALVVTLVGGRRGP